MSQPDKSQTNQLLGYPDDARLLIINADDLGMCGAINEAIFQSLREGVVRSTSLMTPWPAAADAMRWLAQNPDVPFGVHLSVICDSPTHRWAPLTPSDRVPSLIDAGGTFHQSERMDDFVERARLDELEVEFRAQIETVLAANLKPTHLDWHCLRNGGRDDIFDMTLRLAQEYGLAVRAYDHPYIAQLHSQGLATDDHVLLDSYRLDTTDKSAQYAQLLRDLPVGLSEWAVHPGLDHAELQAIEPESWQVRSTDFEFVMSPEARDIIRQEGIILLSYQPLQAVWQGR